MHQNNVYNIEQIVKNLINRSKTVKKKKKYNDSVYCYIT